MALQMILLNVFPLHIQSHLPECQRVISLHLRGGVTDQERPVRHVTQLVVHLFPAEWKKKKKVGLSLRRWSSTMDTKRTKKKRRTIVRILTWRCLPSTTLHRGAQCRRRPYCCCYTGDSWAWLVLVEVLQKKKIIIIILYIFFFYYIHFFFPQ